MPRNFTIETSKQFEDFFNLICGVLLGEGIHRKVFSHRFDKTMVIKIEQDHSSFANIREWQNWDDNQLYKPVANWLAPCIDISPNGIVLLQRRVISFKENDSFPEMVPDWMTDVKPQNFGWLEGRPVLHDYPQMRTNITKKMVKADWEW